MSMVVMEGFVAITEPRASAIQKLQLEYSTPLLDTPHSSSFSFFFMHPRLSREIPPGGSSVTGASSHTRTRPYHTPAAAAIYFPTAIAASSSTCSRSTIAASLLCCCYSSSCIAVMHTCSRCTAQHDTPVPPTERSRVFPDHYTASSVSLTQTATEFVVTQNHPTQLEKGASGPSLHQLLQPAHRQTLALPPRPPLPSGLGR